MDGNASFGYWVRRRRKALDLTQDELARQVGCALSTIRKIESDERRPSRQVAERLAVLLELAPQERPAFLKAARAEQAVDQLAVPPTPIEQPPLQSMPAAPGNLPAPTTRLVGRAHELAQAEALLLRDDVRLLTLTGPGGVGKTRMAVAAAAQLQAFVGEIWFVALAPIRDPELVPSAIAAALGVKESGDHSLLANIKNYLRGRRALLILDNFEQVTAAAPLVADLLASVPGLKALVTSRAVLHLSGEHELVVPPLPVPPLSPLTHSEPAAADAQDWHDLSHYEAVRLFVDRAQAAKADFVLTRENAADVAAICRRLDGLPLAIVLAAARSKLFAPKALLARLDRRLAVLTGGAHDLPARQRTLRDTIDWSYQLLDLGEQTLFARLSVFAGGCMIAAAAAVQSSKFRVQSSEQLNSELNTQNVELGTLEGLAALADKSLLLQEQSADGEPRFSMLETIREYAQERLEQSGETKALHQAHLAYFLMLAEQAEPELTGPRQAEWLDQLEREHDNLRAALAWSLEHGRVELGARLAGALWRFWHIHGHLSEGQKWLEHFLGYDATLTTPTRAKVLLGGGLLSSSRNEYAQGIAYYQQSLALYRAGGDKKGIATTLLGLGWIATDQIDYAQAIACLEESLELFRELGDIRGMAVALNNMGNVMDDQGKYAQAKALHEESLMMRRKLGDKHGLAYSLNNLGTAVQHQADYSLARTLYQEAIILCEEMGDQRGTANTCANLARVDLMQHNTIGARRSFVKALTLFYDIGDRRGIAECLTGLAESAMVEGEPSQAARLYGAVELLRDTIQAPLELGQRAHVDSVVATTRSQLGETAFAAAWVAGRALTLDQAIAEAVQTYKHAS